MLGLLFVGSLLLLGPVPVSPWKVLITNAFAGGSHQTVSVYLANLLASRGHDVTYASSATPVSSLNGDLVRVWDMPELTKFMKEDFTPLAGKMENSNGFREKFSHIWPVLKKVDSICDMYFRDEFIQGLIRREEKFDAIITMALLESCAFGLAHRLKIPIKMLHIPADTIMKLEVDVLGLPLYPAAHNYDGMLIQAEGNVKNSVILRVKSLVTSNLFSFAISSAIRYFIDPDVVKHVPEYPGIFKSLSEVRGVFQHTSPIADLPMPLGPGVIQLAGALCRPFNRSDIGNADLERFLDAGVEGVVFVSFGSYSKTFSAEEFTTLTTTLSRIPYKVVLKADPAKVPALPANVMALNWLPQQAILTHPNTILFVTHGGYASKVEGFCAGVPLLVIPRFAPDQAETLARVRIRGIGDGVRNLRQTNPDELTDKLMHLASDKEVRSRVQRLRDQIMMTRITEDQVMGYMDVVMSGYQLLSGYQPAYQLYFLDVILAPVMAVIIVRFVMKRVRG